MRLRALALASACTCGAPAPVNVEVDASQEALFHSDDRWRGADGAYSTLLPDGRVLWLFGDTFVTEQAVRARAGSTMVHNTVAVQSSTDAARDCWCGAGSRGPGNSSP